MELSELNIKYYRLFNDLFDASPALPERQYDIIAKVLQQQYLAELDICLTENMLEVGEKNFELKFRSKYYLPRRLFLRWNKMAKALLSDYKAEFNVFLNDLLARNKNRHEPTENLSEVDSDSEETGLPVLPKQELTTRENHADETNG